MIRRTLLLAALAAAAVGADPLREAHDQAAALAEQAMAELDREVAKLAREDQARPLVRKAQESIPPAPPRPAPAEPAAPVAPVATTLDLVPYGSGDPVAELERVVAALGVEKGVQVRNGQTLIVATGVAQAAAAPGTPGWIEARAAAYQLAALRARAAVAGAVAEEVLSGRGTSLLEQPPALQDGAPPALAREQIQARAKSAAEAQLDADLKRLGVPPEQYAKLPVEQKRLLFSERYEASVRSRAAAALSGVATLAVTEGPWQGSPCVAVAVVWSQNLARLSLIAQRVGSRLPPVAPRPGARLTDQVPADAARLARQFGVQRLVDEAGDIVLVAYAQAGVAGVAPPLRASALAAAFDKATLEAKGMLKDFVCAEVEAESQRQMAQIAEAHRGERSGQLTATTKQEESFSRSIRSRSTALTLAGGAELRRWSAKIDGCDAAGVVLAWSPRRQSAVAAAALPGQGGSDVQAAPGATRAPAAGAGTQTFDPTW